MDGRSAREIAVSLNRETVLGSAESEFVIMTFMRNADSNKLAEDVVDAYAEFETHLCEKGSFPMFYFTAFFEAAAHYIESMKNSPMIHRNVANSINGLRDILELKSSRAPDKLSAMQIGWNACSFVSMTRILREMSPPACESRKHCISVRAAHDFGGNSSRNPPSC